MGYSTTLSGVDEARLDVIKSALDAKLADLRTGLQRGALLPAGVTALVATMIGDPDSIGAVSECPVIWCVTGGGKAAAVDTEGEWKYLRGASVDVISFKNTWHTQVRAYIHTDLFPAADSTWTNIKAQATQRERLMARLCDWFRADVCATLAIADMTLTSQETSASGDNLTRGVLREIRKGRFEKACGGQQWVYGVEFHIEHLLN